MITNKLTGNARRPVKGDEVAYDIKSARSLRSRARREPIDDPFATSSEWSSGDDECGYRDLKPRRSEP